MTDALWLNAGKTDTVGTATIAASTDLFTITDHGLADGDTITVDTLTGGASGVLVDGAVYFVRDATTDTFAVSLTPKGSVVQFASNGGADVYRFSPQYDAAALRRAIGGLLFHGSGHRFGARNGVLPYSQTDDYVTISGTTWTVNDLVAVVYPALTSQQGPYLVAVQSESGSTNPADGSNPRVDAIDLQIQDDDEDASGFRRGRIVYVSGTPAASPSVPAVTANSLRLATILIPAGGSPAPSVTVTAPFTVARGGVLPVRDETERAQITDAGQHDGMPVYQRDSKALYIYDGTSFNIVGAPQSPTRVIFEENDTFEKADYPWARKVLVRVQAAGGAGGGAPTTISGQGSAGSGGNAGGYAESLLDVSSLPTSVTVTVGSGGTGSAGANGGTGGDSSFGTLVAASGGGGGIAGSASTNSGSPVQPSNTIGVGTAGQIQTAGQAGSLGSRLAAGSRGGTGGSSVLGSGAGNGTLNSNGNNASGYGGGGGGGNNSEGQVTARAGGNGAPGVVIVDIF